MARLPPLDPAMLSGRQKELFDKIASGPRGRVAGPFNVLLQCPGVVDPVQELGRCLRFDGVLPGHLRELGILVAARFWTAQFEWHAHARMAREEGLDAAVIEAIAAGTRRPWRRRKKTPFTIFAANCTGTTRLATKATPRPSPCSARKASSS